MTMLQPSSLTDKSNGIIQVIDLVALHPDRAGNFNELLHGTRESISGVFKDFSAAKGLINNSLSIVDGFLFVFNDPVFASWHTLTWWEQQKFILAIKDNLLYAERSHELLLKSYLAQYINYSDDAVARSTDMEVKQAWMRKRLVLKECFWNVLDSISYAAYHQKKYQEMFPALCLLLCNVTDGKGRKTELLLGIDNGIGCVYKKISRESALLLFLYKTYKFFFRKGVFYTGGLKLGLLETDSELSCHGSGAVVYQEW